MIEIKNLHKSYGSNEVLKGIDQTVSEAEVLCIVGPSGSGKSTMLRCINLLEVPTSGEVFIDGELVTQQNINEIRTKMGMVFQNFNLFPHMTVLDNITCAPINVKGVSKADAEAKAIELLTRVGLANKANAYPRSLSGGQQQRVAIARALVSDAPIILADEPTGNLDETTASDIIATLRSAAHDNGKSVIVVTHSKQLAKAADVVLKLRNKKLTKGYGEKR